MTESQETPAIKAESNGQYKSKNDKEGGDVEGDAEPAHHARRPMNAFLIFCKRHRSVVRDKYPNLENRSITKILGEWWANLEKEEKASYTGLAKQYKDAFFSANPDFKWYKLPAPPLRTFATRPANLDTASMIGDREPYPFDNAASRTTKLEQTNNNHLTKLNYNVQPSTSKQLQGESKQMFTPGKLADEAQMGGISSLLLSDSPPRRSDPDYDLLSRRLMLNSETFTPPGTPKSQMTTNANLMPNPPKKRPFCDDDDDGDRTNFYRNSDVSPPGGDASEARMQKLQDALTETTRSFALSFQTADEKQIASLARNSDNNNRNVNEFTNFIDRDKSIQNSSAYYLQREMSATLSHEDPVDGLTQQKIIDRVVSENLSMEKYQSNVSSDESQDREGHPEDAHAYDKNKNIWMTEFDPAQSRSSGRACKGKLYKQFMAHGGLIVNKRQKKEHAESKGSMRNRLSYDFSPTCSWQSFDNETVARAGEPNDTTDKHADSNVYCEQREMPVSAYKYQTEADDTGQMAYYYDDHMEHGGETADNLGNKMFKASDFDLDAKIGALPSLSLDKFLQKKKENKKRKKNLTSSKHNNNRPRYPTAVVASYPLDQTKGTFSTSLDRFDSTQKSAQLDISQAFKSQNTSHQNITDDDRILMAEQRKSTIIGSKKRKPRKHSITRLDVNSSTNLHHCNDKPEPAKTITTCTNVDRPQHMKATSNSLMPDQNSQNAGDLCALATLAEVAANTCKINEDT